MAIKIEIGKKYKVLFYVGERRVIQETITGEFMGVHAKIFYQFLRGTRIIRGDRTKISTITIPIKQIISIEDEA